MKGARGRRDESAIKILLLLLVVFSPLTGHSMSQFLSSWQEKYPESNSASASCQLCHARKEGGDGWNPYGWAIREELRFGRDLESAFDIAGVFDSDNDAAGSLSNVEIKENRQPGWTVGFRNVVFYKDGTLSADLPPPEDLNRQAVLDTPLPIESPDLDAVLPSNRSIVVSNVVGGFDGVSQLSHIPGNYNVLLVAEKTGKIWLVDLGLGSRRLFHDVGHELTEPSSIGELGLLGLAFHAEFSQNGLFYTFQTVPVTEQQATFSSMPANTVAHHRSEVVEWLVNNPGDLSQAVVSTRRSLMLVDQPQSNKNGGALLLNGAGHLYIGFGDGGGEDDEGVGHGVSGNASDPFTPLGKVLRIDPSGRNSDNGNYGIPPDNPFQPGAGLREIFAEGFSDVKFLALDSETEQLIAGDSTSNIIQEINFVSRGMHYGWSWKLGTYSFFPNGPAGLPGYISTQARASEPAELKSPEYQLSSAKVGVITGGAVRRGRFDGMLLASSDVGVLHISLDGKIHSLSISGSPGMVVSKIYGMDESGEGFIIAKQNSDDAEAWQLFRIRDVVERQLCVALRLKATATIHFCL